MATIEAAPAEEIKYAEHSTSSRAESTSLRYFGCGLLLCALIYVFPVVALRFHLFPHWTQSWWGSVANASYTTGHEDADIVIFGDSSAASNIDPAQMSRDLHLKVIVLPNLSTTLPVMGYRPLERYLAKNKPPRLIVFYFSAWDLDFLHNPFTEIVEEGEEMLLVHGSWSELMQYCIRKPRKVLMFPLHFYGNSNHIADALHLRDHESVAMQNGHILQLPHPTPMKSGCEFSVVRLTYGSATASIAEGVNGFRKPGTDTMPFVSPIPDCAHYDMVENMRHPDLGIAPPQVLPATDFREDGWQAHMLTGTLGPSTQNLEAAIRRRLSATAQPQP